jgi:hypothetical protein
VESARSAQILHERKGAATIAPTRQRMLQNAQRLYAGRAFMAALTAVSIAIYLWNISHSIDFPEYDESDYFFRALHVATGHANMANLSNPGTSPLYVLYYTLWYLILHRSLLYPWVLASSLLMVGMGAYLLLSRFLHPTLSWILALSVLIGTAPIVLGNGLYYFGPGVLWLSLNLLGKHVWQRGLAAFAVLLTVYVRPEYIAVLAILLIGLALYEIQQWRRGQIEWRQLATSYAPVVVGLLLTGYLFANASQYGYNRVSDAIPWSYNNFYRVAYPSQFRGAYSFAQPWNIFEKDFGLVPPPQSVPQTILAMMRNPVKLGQYVSFDAAWLVASFGASLLDGGGWTNQNQGALPINVTAQDTWQFTLAVLTFGLIASGCYLLLRRARVLGRLPLRSDGPARLGILSLAGLIPPLLFINPSQRFFMLYPLVLLLIGIGITYIIEYMIRRWRELSRRRSVWISVLIAVELLMLPRPFIGPSERPVMATIDFIRAHVPPGSSIVGQPADSWTNYLQSEGLDVTGYEAAQFQDSVLVNAVNSIPSINYALLNAAFPQSIYQQWFASWNETYPELPWTLDAQDPDSRLQLYSLPPNSGTRLSYLNFLTHTPPSVLAPATPPLYSALDFSQQIHWQPSDPLNNVQPAYRAAWNVNISCIIMHPNAQGVDADVAHEVTSTLSPAWSSKTLLFLATLAPWAASQPQANGVKFVFSLQGSTFSRTFEVPNFQQPHWLPIIVDLPSYIGTSTLDVRILPRTSVLDDTTLISFIGATQPPATAN